VRRPYTARRPAAKPLRTARSAAGRRRRRPPTRGLRAGQLQPLVIQRPRSASSAKTARSVTRAIDPEAPQAGSGKAAVHLTARRRVPLRGARFELRNGGACSDGRGGAGPCKANQVDLPRSHGAALPRGRRGWDEAQPLDRTLLRVEQAARCITDGGSAARPLCGDHTPPGGPRRSRSEPREARPAAGEGGRQPEAAGGQLQPLVIQRPRGASSGNADRSVTRAAGLKLHKQAPAEPPCTSLPAADLCCEEPGSRKSRRRVQRWPRRRRPAQSEQG